MDRLSNSPQLNEFVKMCNLDNSSLLWRCFAFNEDESHETLSLIFAPCFLCKLSTGSCLPLVLMYTDLSILMESAIQPLPSDVCINKLFSINKNESLHTPPTILTNLSAKLEHFHKMSYLQSIYAVFKQNGNPNVSDIENGLNICNTSEIKINITPLVIAICKHINLNGSDVPINTDTLSKLLETLGDQRQSSIPYTVSISKGDNNSEGCHTRQHDIKKILNKFLIELCLHSIDEMDGYFWLSQHQIDSPKEVNTFKT